MITAAEGTPLKVIRLDGYGNSNTPETAVRGSSTGLALATATGGCASLLTTNTGGLSTLSVL